MTEFHDSELLAAYAGSREEAAFRQIVERYIDLVYGQTADIAIQPGDRLTIQSSVIALGSLNAGDYPCTRGMTVRDFLVTAGYAGTATQRMTLLRRDATGALLQHPLAVPADLSGPDASTPLYVGDLLQAPPSGAQPNPALP